MYIDNYPRLTRKAYGLRLLISVGGPLATSSKYTKLLVDFLLRIFTNIYIYHCSKYILSHSLWENLKHFPFKFLLQLLFERVFIFNAFQVSRQCIPLFDCCEKESVTTLSTDSRQEKVVSWSSGCHSFCIFIQSIEIGSHIRWAGFIFYFKYMIHFQLFYSICNIQKTNLQQLLISNTVSVFQIQYKSDNLVLYNLKFFIRVLFIPGNQKEHA